MQRFVTVVALAATCVLCAMAAHGQIRSQSGDNGATDNRPTDDVKDIPGATNYVNLALTEAISGHPVETAATQPYGCSLKYKGSWF